MLWFAWVGLNMVWHFLGFSFSFAVFYKGQEAVESAPRKCADEAPEAVKIVLRRVQNRGPEGAKIASWRPPGGSWAAVGRQMAAKTAPEPLLGGSWGGLGGSWAALGASFGRLGPARRFPGRLRGRAPGGHFLKTFGQGFWH